MSDDIYKSLRMAQTAPSDRCTSAMLAPLESGVSYERISFDKSVFIESVHDSISQPMNEYRHYQASVEDCRAGFSESGCENEWLIVFAGEHALQPGSASQKTAFGSLSPRTLWRRWGQAVADRMENARAATKANFSKMARQQFPKIVIDSYSGQVDCLDDSIFLVTLKNKAGRPTQLSFPVKLATTAGLASGDFVSYLVVRKDREFDHEFRKEAAPVLTAKEIEDIDSLVDETFE